MKNNNAQIITKLMFRLLPVQILLAVVGSINNIVSSFFASNYVGIDAMSAVGLYDPMDMLIGAISTMMVGGSAIICGKYLGQNEREKLQKIFSLDLLMAAAVSVVFIVILGSMALFDWTGFFTKDPIVRPIFNRYTLGMVLGIFPMIVGNQFPAFLSMENRSRRTMTASIVYIIVNLILNFLFVQVMHMEELGLSLSTSLGLWVFMLVQAHYFLSKDSQLKLVFKGSDWKESKNIFMIGFPGAASYVYQTLRGLTVNKLLESYIGSMAVSAFAAANNVMGLFWSIPSGMLSVSRLLFSVAVGEEDRQTLVDIMKVMFTRFIPLMLAVDLLIILSSGAITSLFFHDPSLPVYAMMRDGLRILPLCMSLSIIMMHFTCFGQTMGRQVYINTLAILDGVAGVVLFSALLIGRMGIKGVYVANVLNGVVTTLYIIGYAWYRKKYMPKSIEDLMVIPDDFGVTQEDRIDISVRTTEGVVDVSRQIQDFCRRKGVDEKKAYLAALAMEEMAGNVVEHGFTKDNKEHSVDVRVVYKDGRIILRIKDDCVPFDPKEREAINDPSDVTKNIGIRMIYKMAKDITYQNVLGLNVLTIKI